MNNVYVKESRFPDFNVHWDTASVRPVKHAVDGKYYMKLKLQREKDLGFRSRAVSTAVTVVRSIEVSDDNAVVQYTDPYISYEPSERGGPASVVEDRGWPEQGEEFANL